MASTAATRKLIAVTAVLALVTVGCSREATLTPAAATRPSTTTSTTEPPTTTTEPPPTTTTAPAPPPGLGVGARGPEVRALQQRLADLRYEVGGVDGVFSAMTAFGVMAFQKAEGMSRTGRATPDVLQRLQTASLQPALVPGGGATRVEVDLPRQILLLWRNNNLDRVVAVSTGNNKRYCVDGQCATAVTPGGSFRVTRRINGWRTSRLGRLYNPLYFNGGIAIHGAPSVPAYPASHGCVRIPMATAEWFPKAVPNGTPVYVVGGVRAPVPFNEPAPGDEPPPTTAPPAPPPPTDPPPPPTTAPRPTVFPPAQTTTTSPPSTAPPDWPPPPG